MGRWWHLCIESRPSQDCTWSGKVLSLRISRENRAWNICSTLEGFHLEVQFIKRTLAANGYPGNFVDSAVNKYLSKKYAEPKEPVAGLQKKKVTLCLPYCGLNSIKISRQIKRIASTVNPLLDIRIVFKAAFKLSRLSKLKSPFSLLSNSGVVYKINCENCSEFYIGMTTRRLEQRLNEHRDCNSAVALHAAQSGHTPALGSPEILARDTNKCKLYVKEALLIKEHRAYSSLNRNISSVDMKLW